MLSLFLYLNDDNSLTVSTTKDISDNTSMTKEILTDILSYGSDKFNKYDKKEICLHVIKSILCTKRFGRPLIDQC